MNYILRTNLAQASLVQPGDVVPEGIRPGDVAVSSRIILREAYLTRDDLVQMLANTPALDAPFVGACFILVHSDTNLPRRDARGHVEIYETEVAAQTVIVDSLEILIAAFRRGEIDFDDARVGWAVVDAEAHADGLVTTEHAEYRRA